jgi:cyclic pyranopterin phosphate synthase
MPEDGICLLPHDQVLRNEEFLELIDIFAEMGVTKVRFTGGEPLVRKGSLDIIQETRRRHPDLELALTTNGVLLKDHLDRLEDAGVRRLNISLDTLSRERFQLLTGRDYLGNVLESIDGALEHSFFDVKINTVLYKETLDELPGLLEYFRGRSVALRFIEMMPAIGGQGEKDFIAGQRIIDSLREMGILRRNQTVDTQVALMYDFFQGESHYKIGIIPPISHNFCSRCNRLRLTADGFLKTCLFAPEEFSLRDILRKGENRREIQELIGAALSVKGRRQNISGQSDVSRTMSRIGG